MEYPRDFPADAEARVELEKILAQRIFDRAKATFIREYEKDKDRRFVTALLIDCILRVFEAFGEEACILGRSGAWTVSAVETHARDFLKKFSYEFARERGYDNYGHALPDILSLEVPGEISFEFENCLRQSNPWLDFQKNRHWVAIAHLVPKPSKTPDAANPAPSPEEKQSQEPRPELLMGKETVNKKQAALALGVSMRTLDRYIADRRLLPTGDFTRKRFKSKDLLSFLRRDKANI